MELLASYFPMDDGFSMWLFEPFNCMEGKPSMVSEVASLGIVLGSQNTVKSIKGSCSLPKTASFSADYDRENQPEKIAL